MSFSSEVKKEMAAAQPDKPCCRAAQLYGMLEMGHAFSPAAISLQTENPTVAQGYASLLHEVCAVPEPEVQRPVKKSGFYIVTVRQAEDRLRVMERFGHGPGELNLRLNRANLDCEGCAAAYLRGAFLSCGAVTNPAADYHLEFSVPYRHLSRDLFALLRELDFRAGLAERKGCPVVYLKESEQIEDCLTMLGASSASMELMNIKIVKDVRNLANRLANCENANIDKTVTAASAQTEAIRRIQSRRGLDSLPQDLRELAQLRLENPDLSLRELGQLLDPPLSRSGVNHRLHRLMELAQENTQ